MSMFQMFGAGLIVGLGVMFVIAYSGTRGEIRDARVQMEVAAVQRGYAEYVTVIEDGKPVTEFRWKDSPNA